MIIHWIRNHRRSAILVGLTLLVPMYFFLSALGYLMSARAGFSEQIDSIEPRIARLQGLIINESALREAVSGVSDVINDNVYSKSTSSAAVAASLQAEARRMLASAGMEVTNSQVLPVRQRDGFDYVAVKVVARGSLSGLEESLGALARFRPVILIESIDAFPNRQRNAEVQVLTVSLDLLSLRVAP